MGLFREPESDHKWDGCLYWFLIAGILAVTAAAGWVLFGGSLMR